MDTIQQQSFSSSLNNIPSAPVRSSPPVSSSYLSTSYLSLPPKPITITHHHHGQSLQTSSNSNSSSAGSGSSSLRRGGSFVNFPPRRIAPPRGECMPASAASIKTTSVREKAASGYAAALAEVGKSHNILESLGSDMRKLGQCLEDPLFSPFFSNPAIADDKKKKTLRTLSKELGFHPYTTNLLILLLERKRVAIFADLVAEFEAIYGELTTTNTTEIAVITSAVKVEKLQLSLIAKKIRSLTGAKKLRMQYEVDPSLIAGFVVKFGKDGSRFIDMSVKGQLEQITDRQTGIPGLSGSFGDKVGAF